MNQFLYNPIHGGWNPLTGEQIPWHGGWGGWEYPRGGGGTGGNQQQPRTPAYDATGIQQMLADLYRQMGEYRGGGGVRDYLQRSGGGGAYGGRTVNVGGGYGGGYGGGSGGYGGAGAMPTAPSFSIGSYDVSPVELDDPRVARQMSQMYADVTKGAAGAARNYALQTGQDLSSAGGASQASALALLGAAQGERASDAVGQEEIRYLTGIKQENAARKLAADQARAQAGLSRYQAELAAWQAQQNLAQQDRQFQSGAAQQDRQLSLQEAQAISGDERPDFSGQLSILAQMMGLQDRQYDAGMDSYGSQMDWLKMLRDWFDQNFQNAQTV